MKRIKLCVFDDSKNINFGESPIWRNSKRYEWKDLYVHLNLPESLITRIRDWKFGVVATNKYQREELVKCEIEGLAILLELRKELPDYEITYSSNFNSYNCVLNEEQEDDY